MHGVVVPKYHIFLFALGCVIGISLWTFLNRTKTGKHIRAASEDADITSALGVNVSRLFTIVFMIGTWLAALGGVVMMPQITVILGVDMDIIIQCFVVVIIGGMGSMGGAFLGALSLGVVNAIGYVLVPRFVIVSVYVLLAIVLIVRPKGFLGKFSD